MKCTKCGHTWLPNETTLSPACPKCQGAARAENLGEALWLVFQTAGPTYLRDEQKLLAVFSDIAPHLKKEHNLLEIFVKQHGPSRLTADPSDNTIRILTRDLRDNYGMHGSTAEELCSAYLAALQGKAYIPTNTGDTPPAMPAACDPSPNPAKKSKINLKRVLCAAALCLVGALLGQLIVSQVEQTPPAASDQSITQQQAPSTPVVDTPADAPAAGNDDSRLLLDLTDDYPTAIEYEADMHLIPASNELVAVEAIPAMAEACIFFTPDVSGMYHFDCGYWEAETANTSLEVSYRLNDMDEDLSEIVSGHYSVPASLDAFTFTRYYFLQEGHTYQLRLDTSESTGKGPYVVLFSPIPDLTDGIAVADRYDIPGQKNYYAFMASEDGDYRFSLTDADPGVSVDAWSDNDCLFEDATDQTIHLHEAQLVLLQMKDEQNTNSGYTLNIEKIS